MKQEETDAHGSDKKPLVSEQVMFAQLKFCAFVSLSKPMTCSSGSKDRFLIVA